MENNFSIPTSENSPLDKETSGMDSDNNPVILDNNSSVENQNNSQKVSSNNHEDFVVGNSVDSEASSSGAVTNSNSTSNMEPLDGDKNEKNETAETNNESEKLKQGLSSDTTEENRDIDNNIYHVKWISFSGSECGVITQNINGPCPLISIINVLSLRGRLKLPSSCQVISAEQLLENLADMLINMQPDSLNAEQDFHHNMNDAIAILPKLQSGLDVNIRFSGVKDFEYTPECIIFDMVGTGLYHGWLVDPQMEEVVLAVGNMSYNQVVEYIITGRSSEDSLEEAKALLAEQFLEESASQLTYHGICELNSVMKDGQLAVFFRNNHFSTLCKHGDTLYLLVTDQGFLDQADVVWETLDNIQGDTVFVDQHFNLVQSQGSGTMAEERSDHEIAMSLQKQDLEGSKRDKEWDDFKQNHLGGNQDQLSDEELARRLQEVENAAAEHSSSSNQQGNGEASASNPHNPIGPRRNQDKKCTIL